MLILNKYLNQNTKIIISVIVGMIWIYFRTEDCYKMLPRQEVLPTIFVGIWIYLNYLEPLFLPIGLGMMMLYKICF